LRLKRKRLIISVAAIRNVVLDQDKIGFEKKLPIEQRDILKDILKKLTNE